MDFYNEISKPFLEIGIALSRIDRMNPGKVPFSIPVLTPTMNNDIELNSDVVQNSHRNINSDANIPITNISISNNILIEIPRELCALPGAIYDIKGIVNIINGSITINSASHSGNLHGSGSVIPSPGGSISVNGGVSGTITGVESIGEANITGTLELTLNDSNRYIEKGSKWLIGFVGGDVSYPVVLCRL